MKKSIVGVILGMVVVLITAQPAAASEDRPEVCALLDQGKTSGDILLIFLARNDDNGYPRHARDVIAAIDDDVRYCHCHKE